MIKVDLITGFLGSGKTTFLKKYVSHLLEMGERVGILENDYGAINVDMLLLGELRSDNCELEMVAGGCDADCYRRRFKTKLISMAMSGYTRVVIEPSGIFDILDFYDTLRDDPLDNWYEIGSVFCIVDALIDTDMTEAAEYVLGTQIANSGCIIMSRVQEATADELQKTKQYLERVLCKLGGSLNTKIFAKDWDEITDSDYSELMKAGYKVMDLAKKYDFDDLEYESLYYLESGLSIEEMQDKAKRLLAYSGKIIRIKGFVQADESNWYELNATRHDCTVNITKQGQEVFIIIGENLNKEKITQIMGVEAAV